MSRMRRVRPGEFPLMKLKSGKAPLNITQVGYHVRSDGREFKMVFYTYMSDRSPTGFDYERGPRELCDFELYSGPIPAPPIQEVTINMNGITAKETVAHIMNKMKPGYNFLTGEDEPKENEMADLYQTKEETPRFGNPLLDGTGKAIKNSLGQMVLEMKGEGGKIEAFAPDQIELVTPYTVSLTCLSDNQGSGMHVVAKPGQVEVDQMLLELSSGKLWRVVQLDSKCRSPKENKSRWLLVPTSKITFGEADVTVLE